MVSFFSRPGHVSFRRHTFVSSAVLNCPRTVEQTTHQRKRRNKFSIPSQYLFWLCLPGRQGRSGFIQNPRKTTEIVCTVITPLEWKSEKNRITSEDNNAEKAAEPTEEEDLPF